MHDTVSVVILFRVEQRKPGWLNPPTPISPNPLNPLIRGTRFTDFQKTAKNLPLFSSPVSLKFPNFPLDSLIFFIFFHILHEIHSKLQSL